MPNCIASHVPLQFRNKTTDFLPRWYLGKVDSAAALESKLGKSLAPLSRLALLTHSSTHSPTHSPTNSLTRYLDEDGESFIGNFYIGLRSSDTDLYDLVYYDNKYKKVKSAIRRQPAAEGNMSTHSPTH